MVKLTLDMNTFKALASDTRLDILKVLDGKHMSLKDISTATSLNKATLHEHLCKLNEAGLVKRKERDGHKWVYYKLTWKGECLLHPENTRIVVLFCSTFFTLFLGIVQLINYAKGIVVAKAYTVLGSDTTNIYGAESKGLFSPPSFSQAPIANVPTASQTATDLSIAVTRNANIKTIGGGGASPADIDWGATVGAAAEETERYLIDSTGDMANSNGDAAYDGVLNFGSSASDAPMAQIAIWHNPELQIIGIILIAACCVLFSIGIWRVYKNRKIKF